MVHAARAQLSARAGRKPSFKQEGRGKAPEARCSPCRKSRTHPKLLPSVFLLFPLSLPCSLSPSSPAHGHGPCTHPCALTLAPVPRTHAPTHARTHARTLARSLARTHARARALSLTYTNNTRPELEEAFEVLHRDTLCLMRLAPARSSAPAPRNMHPCPHMYIHMDTHMHTHEGTGISAVTGIKPVTDKFSVRVIRVIGKDKPTSVFRS
jgi:hypothetical protein